jgi:hypothetical protein
MHVMAVKKYTIIRFRLASLRNSNHVELNRLFIARVKKHGASELGILALFTAYVELFTEEELVFDIIFSSELTIEIKELDAERDRLYRGLSDGVKSALNHFSGAKREAARKLERVLKHYGDVPRESLSAETAIIYDVLRELAKPENLALVTLLELTAWLAPLEEVNAALEDAMSERFVEISKRPEQRMKTIRLEVDTLLRAILDKVEAMGQTGSPFYNPAFVNEVNAVMLYYKDLIAREAGHRHPVKDISTGDHLAVEPIETQPYTGRVVTPIPRAYFREEGKPDVELIFTKDFTVTYKNNVEAGTADVIIHGAGEYRGKKVVTFTIAR